MKFLNTTLKKNSAIAYIVNGFMSQLVTTVTVNPLGFFVASTMLEKSTLSIIG